MPVSRSPAPAPAPQSVLRAAIIRSAIACPAVMPSSERPPSNTMVSSYGNPASSNAAHAPRSRNANAFCACANSARGTNVCPTIAIFRHPWAIRYCIAARSPSSLGKFTASTVGVSSHASSSTRGRPPLSLASGRFVPNPVACRISPSKSCPENGLLVSACSAASGEYWVCSMNGVNPREVISRLNVCVSFE